MAVEARLDRNELVAVGPGRAPGTSADGPAIAIGGGAFEGRRVALAAAIVEILSRAIGDPDGLQLQLDETNSTPVPPTLQSARSASASPRVRINGPDAVARLIWPPTPDAFGEAYLRGDIEIDGDVMAAVASGKGLDVRRIRPEDARRLVRWGIELRRGMPPARALERVARLSGPLHSRARDMAAIRFHYDVGEAFYSLWLDRRLTYSCAYFQKAVDPAADLDAAQEAKLDLICRKLDLQPGQRLLDIGCGWGSLINFAAERYGVDAVGVTLSQRQADEANRRAALAGLGDRATAEVRDYRDLSPLGAFDAVASVGMFEHVGARNLGPYFRAAFEALKPGAMFLNHGIATTRRRAPLGGLLPTAAHFLDRYVFPDGELVPVSTAIEAAHDGAGFELLDVQLLGPHYALTLAAWVARLERSWDAAVAAAGEEVARTWRLYMSAARLGFERGELEVAHLLLARPALDGPAPRPLRPWW
jgi:cyclopropane-fatty-acyl-phospholipid synthase